MNDSDKERDNNTPSKIDVQTTHKRHNTSQSDSERIYKPRCAPCSIELTHLCFVSTCILDIDENTPETLKISGDCTMKSTNLHVGRI